MSGSGKVWFVTGASGGFGREWTEAALERGDRVVATARTPSKLDALVDRFGERVLSIELDVSDRRAVFEAVETGHAHFGRLDVVVSNAGYGHYGLVEELSEDDIRAVYETNVFGSIWVIQAVLPYLRAQRSGHIFQISSIGGVTTSPLVSIYDSSKWAVEGIAQALAAQVAGFGIKVTIIEPQGYSTEFSASSAKRALPMPEYADYRSTAAPFSTRRGDPAATRGPFLELVDSDQPPLRQFFGVTPFDVAAKEYEGRLAEWRSGQERAVRAFGDVPE
ncbi:SDR family NAD(P)-dependent oxidoreductase [Microbacterium sp. NPDC077663]|uniref:SDR family NAD(P)-dependent oxidoreductase n=1 Tax=Microbacterium sp. NPDC077663 TaxID=3364189 RepID=UPI0037C9132D